MQQIKVPISVQAASLTEEQRLNVEKSYKICTIISLIFLAIFAIAVVSVYSYIKDLDAQMEFNDTQVELLELQQDELGYSFSRSSLISSYRSEWWELSDKKLAVLKISMVALAVFFLVYVGIYFGVYFSYKKKYPYFGERMFWAVKKLRRQEKKNMDKT